MSILRRCVRFVGGIFKCCGQFIGRVLQAFFRDDCLNLAANISFCALLSIIPVAMLMVSIAGYFVGGSHDAYMRIVEVSSNLLPVGRETFLANVESVLFQRSSLGLVGVLFLVFIATVLVSSIERALDIIFKTVHRRHFVYSRLLGIALIFWVTLLFALPTMVQILEGLLARYGFAFPLSEYMAGKAFFLVIAFLAYLVTVVVVPNRKVHVRSAMVGAIFFALGISVAKFVFRAYMHLALTRYNLIYGSLAAVILLVVWIYYLAVVMLLAAEIVAQLQGRMSLPRRQDEEKTDWDGVE